MAMKPMPYIREFSLENPEKTEIETKPIKNENGKRIKGSEPWRKTPRKVVVEKKKKNGIGSFQLDEKPSKEEDGPDIKWDFGVCTFLRSILYDAYIFGRLFSKWLYFVIKRL
jgi:hypothetical protein